MAYSNAIFYINLYGGGVGDGVRTTLTNVIASNPSGSITRMTKTAHGLVDGAVVTLSLYTAWLNGDWKIENVTANTFDLVGAVWQATADADGSVVPFGGSSWADAWTTITNGATVARIAPGDTIRISKSPDPTTIGNASWTDCPTGGFNPVTVNIASSTNATPIEITTSGNHNLVTGDVALINAHTTNYTANGNWIITYVSPTKFTLDNSVGVGVGGAAGTIRKVNSKAVVLATAQTQNVVTTEGGWTGAGDTTVTYSTTHAKSGYQGLLCTLDASVQTSTKQAYKAISSTDFSSKQKLSFWIYNSSAILVNQWYIALCSDTAGATPVDIFKIPAIPSTTRGVILSIAKFGGGNLGNAIQSVAVYTDTVAPTASSSIRLDNFQACTTNGLQGDSLISKNGTAQGGTEGFYGIQSINGKVVMLDTDTNTLATTGKGYSGTTETVETFIRNTFKTPIASSVSIAANTINDSGAPGNLISYEFGYEVGTTNQNGMTIFDGLNGYGYGIYASSKHYNSLNYYGYVRVYQGIWFNNSHNNTLTSIGNIGNNQSYGIYFDNSNNNTITNVSGVMNNSGFAIYFSSSHYNTISNVIGVRNNQNYGIYFYNSHYNTISNVIGVRNNQNYGIMFVHSSNNHIKTISTSNNNGGGIYANLTNYIRNASIDEPTEFTVAQWTQGILWSYDHDQTDGNHWGFFYGGTFNIQSGTVHDTETVAWKTAITSADRKSTYKVILPVAEVAGVASQNLTFKAWVKKDHATNIASRLVCYEDDALGITEVSSTKVGDTNWEELTLVLNSPHANPVFKIYLETWYVAGNSNSYVGKITVT